MIRFLADYAQWYGPLRLFDSITFRVMLGIAVSFALTLFLGRLFIRYMRKHQATEDVHKPDSDTLNRLHAKKQGTPTMGGLVIVAVITLGTILFCDPTASPLLHVNDLQNGQLLCQTLLAAERPGTPSPARQIWSLLDKNGKAASREIAESGYSVASESSARLIQSINALLLRTDFFKPTSFSEIQLDARTTLLLTKDPHRLLIRNRLSMNRALLRASFPGRFQPQRKWNPTILTGLALILAFGLLGMVDDWAKLRGKGKQGLSKRQKLFAQIALAGLAALAFSLQADPSYTTRLLVPFTKWETVHPDLGWGYYAFFAFVIVACSNAVNLTDGLDGLASGCSVMVCVTYIIIAYAVGNALICSFFRIPHVPGSGECAIFCAVLTGALLGFLWFNAHPAQVFMGDTGSLALGAGIAYVALATKQEFTLIVAGGIFVFEAFSVLAQMTSFRLTGKRIFKCAPFHHHLEFSGWHENKVVVRLWIAGAILAAVAIATLKLH